MATAMIRMWAITKGVTIIGADAIAVARACLTSMIILLSSVALLTHWVTVT